MVRIGGDVHIELARRRRDVGIDVDAARRLQGERRIAARRLRDGIRYGDGVVIRSREIRRLNGYRCAAVQRICDGLHIRLRAGFRISRCARLDLNIAGIDQPFARLARFGRSIDASCDLHLRTRCLDRAARARAFAACRDLARELRHTVRPDGDRAARCALCRRISTQSRAALDRNILRVREVTRTLPTTADLDRTGFRAAHIRHTARSETHVIRRHAHASRCTVQARGTHDALLIDRRARQRIARRCGHENEASVCFDETFVRDRLLHRRLRRDDRDLAVAVKVQRHGFARREHRCALLRHDNALVHDILAEQGDRPLIFRKERGAVDDFPIGRRADKGVFSRHKVRIRNVHRRGDNRTRICLCTGCKEHTRRVDEKDATVRRERAEDLGGIPPEHTVQQSRLGIRLIDIDALTRADVERVPVDDGILRCLMNRHLRL